MALLEPALTPGFYGDFADEISLYYCCTSADKKIYHMFFSDDSHPEKTSRKSESEWTEDDYDFKGDDLPSSHANLVKPKYAVEVQPGIAKHQITLRNGYSGDDPPLALSGNNNNYRSTPIVALPATPENTARNKIVPIDHSSKSKGETWTFASQTTASTFLDDFQWRSSTTLEDTHTVSSRLELVRLGSTSGPMEEIVATWTAESTPIDHGLSEQGGNHVGLPNIKLGTLRFEGAGRGSGLGAYWRLLVVMTVLRMSQPKWDTLTPVGPVDAMRMKARKVFGLSVDFGMGMLATGGFAS